MIKYLIKEMQLSSIFKYATVRLTQQQTYNSNVSPTCRVVGVNPAGLNEDIMKDYAKEMANMLYADFDDEQWNRIYCLQTGTWLVHWRTSLQYSSVVDRLIRTHIFDLPGSFIRSY